MSKTTIPSGGGAQSVSNETSTTEASKEFEVVNPISNTAPASGQLFSSESRDEHSSKESINLLDDASSVENVSKEVVTVAAPAPLLAEPAAAESAAAPVPAVERPTGASTAQRMSD